MPENQNFVRLTKELILKNKGNKLTIYTEDKSKAKDIHIARIAKDGFYFPCNNNNFFAPFPDEKTNIFIYD